MSTYASRLSAASSFLLQSPPGEGSSLSPPPLPQLAPYSPSLPPPADKRRTTVNDVYQDVRNIVGDDALFESGILPALEQYNTEQLVVVNLEGNNVLITTASRLEGQKQGAQERHIDPRTKVSFVFDHTRAIASDPLPFQTDAETEEIRAELDKLVEPYVRNHYHEGVCAVYAMPDANYPTVVEEVVVEVEREGEGKGEGMDQVESSGEKGEEAEVKEGEEVKEKEDKMETEEEKDKEEDKEEDKVEETKDIAMADDEPAPPPPPAAVPATIAKFEPPPVRSRIFGIYLVGNKYNASNYLTGRWRSIYTVDLSAGTFTGKTSIAVHYYENGNVQLSTTHTTSSPLPTPPTSISIVALVKASEEAIQRSVGDTYAGLAEDGFRGLRRALPKTRSKVDWGKIVAYRLGGELGGSA